MYAAPFGVGGAMAYTVGKMGIGVLLNGLYLVLTFFLISFDTTGGCIKYSIALNVLEE